MEYDPLTGSGNIRRIATVTVGTSRADILVDPTASDHQKAVNEALNRFGDRGVAGHVQIVTDLTINGSILVPTGCELSQRRGTTVSLANSSNAHMVRNKDQTSGNDTNIRIVDLNLAGNGSNQSSSVYGIYLKETTNSVIRNCRVTASRGWGIVLEGDSEGNKNSIGNVIEGCIVSGVVSTSHDGIYFINCEDCVVRNCRSYGNARRGIHPNRSRNCIVQNCIVTANGSGSSSHGGIIAFKCDYLQILGNQVHDNGGRGIDLQADTGGASCNYCIVQGNLSRDNVHYGIIVGASNTPSVGNQIIGNKSYSNDDDGIVALYAPETVIADNQSYSNADQGIAVDNSPGCSITGNIVKANSTEGIEIKNSSHNCSVLSNICKNNSQGAGSHGGIVVEAAITDTVIVGNRSYDDQGTKTQEYGLDLQATSDYSMVLGNNFRGNNTASLQDSGGANTVKANNIAP